MNTATFLFVMTALIVATFFMGRWSKQAEIEDSDLEALRRIHLSSEDA